MRGVDLEVFDFDFDLTWAAFFLSPDGTVHGRYGGRDADSAESQVSLAGLKYAMSRALAAQRRHVPTQATAKAKLVRTVDQYPAAKRLKASACVHCHQVYDFRREELQTTNQWRLDEVWVYPQPENVGLTLDVDQGDRVRRVASGSIADKAGLKAGDFLTTVNGMPVAALADVRYALHRAPAKGQIPITWRREGKTLSNTLRLPEGWRKTDISWRWSLRGLDPAPGIQGEDLSAQEKQALGLAEKDLALRQGPFVSPQAEQAGLRAGDVILGMDGKTLAMNGRQFIAHVRLNCKVGEVIALIVLRDGKRLQLPMKLMAKAP